MIYNFYAGPAILPKTVLAEAAKSVLELNDIGLSILEISHRSKEIVAIMEESRSLVKELLGVGDDWEVLYLQGGASSQFFMTAMNFLSPSESAAYIDTGSWTSKAIKEARRFGKVDVVASSEDSNFNYIPKDYTQSDAHKYLYLCSNNTIFGTQYQALPDASMPIIGDMSSDIFSRPIDMDRFGLIFAGAQKNLGPAGTTLVIVRKSFLESKNADLPTMLDYSTHVKKDSAFNTPPVFPIYVSMLTLRWIKEHGGLTAMQQRNQEKADLIYGEIDRNALFYGTAAEEDRSHMNVCFKLHDDDKKDAFMAAAADAGCVGIKGHRSVGGFRASIYNAMDIDGVKVLVDLMKQFEQEHG